MFLVTKWFGSFLLEDDGSIVEKRLFDEEDIRGKLEEAMNGRIVEEEKALAAFAGTLPGKGKMKVTEKRLLGLENSTFMDLSGPGGPGEGGESGGPVIASVLERALDPVDFGYDPAILPPILEEIMSDKQRSAAAGAAQDALISAAVHTLEDMQQFSNLMAERMEEWHGAFSTRPLSRKMAVKLPGAIIEATSEDAGEPGDRGNAGKGIIEAPPEGVEGPGMSEKNALEDVPVEFVEEFGWEHARRLELDLLATVAYSMKGLMLTREGMEKYIQGEMERFAPNLNAIAGPQVGAALIAAAGSLKRLAMLPAGTVQLLGAEKAFFRFLKEGDKPPKHGFIYRIPTIRRAPRQLRGRLSRHYATRISIAARMDFFSPQKGLNEEFLEKFMEKRAKILEEGGKKKKTARSMAME